MPNSFAYIVLSIWPIIAIVLYRKMDSISATFWVIVGGYLLLPARTVIDLPLIPPLGHNSIPVLSALFGCIFVKKLNITLLPKKGIERWLVILLIILPVFTAVTNTEPVFDGSVWNKGLTWHDTLSSIIRTYLKILPFIIGTQLIKSRNDLLQIFKLLVIACLFYSLPILFEIRMSPHLHTWVYGFFPHGVSGGGWAQHYRFGGFRPVVFIGHGLLVAIFVAISLGAATIIWKNKIRIFNIPPLLIILYLLFVLLLCKSVGAFILGALLMLSIIWIPITVLKRMSIIVISFVILYPVISILEIFPHQEILDFVAGFDTDRAQSLGFRFYHENKILQHSQEKFLFGWGGWGRNLFFDSIPDGYWIIQYSLSGIIGFSAIFGLSLKAVLNAIKASTIATQPLEKSLLAFSSFMICIIMLDQLPNSSLYSWLWFIIGAISGSAKSIINSK